MLKAIGRTLLIDSDSTEPGTVTPRFFAVQLLFGVAIAGVLAFLFSLTEPYETDTPAGNRPDGGW